MLSTNTWWVISCILCLVAPATSRPVCANCAHCNSVQYSTNISQDGGRLRQTAADCGRRRQYVTKTEGGQLGRKCNSPSYGKVKTHALVLFVYFILVAALLCKMNFPGVGLPTGSSSPDASQGYDPNDPNVKKVGSSPVKSRN